MWRPFYAVETSWVGGGALINCVGNDGEKAGEGRNQPDFFQASLRLWFVKQTTMGKCEYGEFYMQMMRSGAHYTRCWKFYPSGKPDWSEQLKWRGSFGTLQSVLTDLVRPEIATVAWKTESDCIKEGCKQSSEFCSVPYSDIYFSFALTTRSFFEDEHRNS